MEIRIGTVIYCVILAALVFCVVGAGNVAATESITSCGEIDEPGAYELTANITTNETCLEITADDVHLSGGNHTISSDQLDGPEYAVVGTGIENVSVSALSVIGWRYDGQSEAVGVLFDNVTNTTVRDITVVDTTDGILLENASTAVIESVDAHDNGIPVGHRWSSDVIIRDVHSDESVAAIGVVESNRSTISNVSISNSTYLGMWIEDVGDLEISDVTVDDTPRGIGVSVSGTVTISNVTLSGGDYGISFENSVTGSVEDASLSGHEEYAIGSIDGAAMELSGVDVRPSNGSNTTLSGSIVNASIAPVTDRPKLDVAEGIGHFVEFGALGPDPTFNASISYQKDDVDIIDQESLRVWVHDGDWQKIVNSTVDIDRQVVAGTVVEPGIIGVLGTRVAPIPYDALIENDGSIYSIGFPGPTNGTLGDAFPQGTGGLSIIYEYDEGSWEQVTDFDRPVSALDAFVVVTDGESGDVPVRVLVEPNEKAGNKNVSTGWNYLAASAFDTADSAFNTSEILMVLDRYSHGTSQDYDSLDRFGYHIIGSESWGVDAPTLNPFAGYFVYVETGGSVSPVLSDVPTEATANEILKLEGT